MVPEVSCLAEVFLVHADDPHHAKVSGRQFALHYRWRQWQQLCRENIGTRMDDFAKATRSITSEISEVARDGLILWRLTRSQDRDLWCLVFESSIGFVRVVEDHPEGSEPPCMSERHADFIAHVGRTDTLKDTFLRDGWTEVDVD